MKNIFDQLPDKSADEIFETLIGNGDFQLERIISTGQATPKGEWLESDRDEWVVLLKGGAGLLIEGAGDVCQMKPGDHINIPANVRHRVEWTESEGQTVWLALYYCSKAL